MVKGRGKKQRGKHRSSSRYRAQRLHFNFKTNTHTHAHTVPSSPQRDLKKLREKQLAFSVKSSEIGSQIVSDQRSVLKLHLQSNPCATATCNMQRVQRLQPFAATCSVYTHIHTYKINHNSSRPTGHCPRLCLRLCLSATDSLKCCARHRKPHTDTHCTNAHTLTTHTHTHTHRQAVWVFGLQAAISAVC